MSKEEVRFFDPQSGSDDVTCYFATIVTSGTEFARTDNFDFADALDDCCTTRSEHANSGRSHKADS